MPQSESSNDKFCLAVDAMSSRLSRFIAELVEPDPEGESVLRGERKRGAGMRESEIRRAGLGPPP